MRNRTIGQKVIALILVGILSMVSLSINAIANQNSSIPNTWNDILTSKEQHYEIYHAYSDVVYAALRQVLNDDPELSEEVLAEMVQYSLYDLDDDGIAELFVNVATSEASAYIDVYSYNNGLIHLGQLSGFYSSIWNDGENTVRWEQVGDHRAIYSISILNKKIVEKKVYEDLNEDTVPEGYANYANSSYSGSDTYGLDSIVGTFLCYEEMDYNNHIYRIYSSVLSPENADVFCESNNGHLVSIASSKENDAIASYINGKNSLTTVGWYTGLHFTGNNSGFQYEWLDGTDYNYSNWEEGYDGFLEAHDSERNDIYGVLLSSGKWHSSLWSWGDFQSFICEWDSKEDYQSWYTANGNHDDVIDNPTESEDVALFVNPTSLSINVDETKKITAMYAPPLEEGKSIKWASSDESVASVANDGTVNGVGSGTATITATYPDTSISANCLVKVVNDKDTDRDGLPDEWEKKGVNGVRLDLMGADPYVPDVFVEVDWMKGYKPKESALAMVSKVFKEHGINLHIDLGAESIDYVTGKKWGNLSSSEEIDYKNEVASNDEWESLVNQHFSRNRFSCFRHCLFINHYYEYASTGVGLMPGQYFMVADVDGYVSGSDIATAGTFMHELGHTLGLDHGGNESANNKPNYLSVMNYLFQTAGVGGKGINYSEYELPAIDENHINEQLGFDPNGFTKNSGLGTTWYNGKETCTITRISQNKVDMNNDSSFDSDIKMDLNGDGDCAIIHKSINDWDNLVFKTNDIGKEISGDITISIKPEDVTADELTVDEAETIASSQVAVAYEPISAADDEMPASSNLNGIIQGPDGKWAMYKDGKVDTSYNGIAKNQYGWWKVTNGYVTFKETGIFKNEFGWWRVENSKVNFKASGIYKNQYGWWKTKDGKVTFKETGIFKNEYGWWRVENSKVNFKANGIYKNPYGWWKTNDGKVTFKENGVFKNEYGWWKVKDSKVDFSFTGIASNKYGKWYIKDGKVDFSKNGKVKYNGATYSIKNGKVQ